MSGFVGIENNEGSNVILAKEYYEHFSNSRFYLASIVAIACLLMVTGLIPFEVVLIPTVAAAPKKWRKIAACGVIGSALGAVVLAFLFQNYGRIFVEHFFPTLQTSKGWIQAEEWIQGFGTFALTGIAALPIAQLPAIAVCGLMRISLLKILAAFLVGKALKYGIIANLTSKAEIKFRDSRAKGLSKTQIR